MMLKVTDLSKEYPTPRGALRVLSGVTFDMAPGDAAAIMGPSGSGKSSLLYILGGLEPPSSGTVTLELLPLNTSALPYLPAAFQLVPLAVPALPVPEVSAIAVPVPSLNP